MKKQLLIIGFALFVCLTGFDVNAKKVDVQTAANVAMNIYAERSGQTGKKAAISQIIEEKEHGETMFYVFKYEDLGFAIVSAEDAVRPLLGYSFESSFDENNHSPAFEFFILKRLKKQIYAVVQAKKTPNPTTVAEWAK
ncbi:MAG: Spi family protease inhibitor, partial [Bacteroidales bacterium]|nr:Spi family protease inhibitor [Bacteroidales bacterium]